jgi:hypothetical protein
MYVDKGIYGRRGNIGGREIETLEAVMWAKDPVSKRTSYRISMISGRREAQVKLQAQKASQILLCMTPAASPLT